MRALLFSLVLLSACGRGIEPAEPAAPFTEVTLATKPGLSGLAVDETGALWTVAERDNMVYRITLDTQLRPALEELPVEGVPSGVDLEGVAILGNDQFALGTEGRTDGAATILRAERRGPALVVTGELTISEREAGLPLEANRGAEGVCGRGNQIITVLEVAGTDQGRRWAPLLRIVDGKVASTHRVWLTSTTGKLSGLDCVIDPDGTVHAWAIERHFEVSKVLGFTLAAGATAPITPTVLADLGAALGGRVNLEGIARLPDGRIVMVTDNQWKSIEGPSLMLVLSGRY
ncbi:MAG: esterase-like activity of phytase family protein [Kofleriaceae bacterium]|nr:esterase-like activity of phytase family protein [Kofleriaceae bacterium]